MHWNNQHRCGERKLSLSQVSVATLQTSWGGQARVVSRETFKLRRCLWRVLVVRILFYVGLWCRGCFRLSWGFSRGFRRETTFYRSLFVFSLLQYFGQKAILRVNLTMLSSTVFLSLVCQVSAFRLCLMESVPVRRHLTRLKSPMRAIPTLGHPPWCGWRRWALLKGSSRYPSLVFWDGWERP